MTIFVKPGVRTGKAVCPTCDLNQDEDGNPLDPDAVTTHRGIDGKKRCDGCNRVVELDLTLKPLGDSAGETQLMRENDR